MKKILIVDEEYWSIEPLLDRLTHEMECEITHALNCSSARLLLAQYPYDFVILDIMVPEYDEDDDAKDIDKEPDLYGGLGLLLEFSKKENTKIIGFSCSESDEIRHIFSENNAFFVSKLSLSGLDKLMQMIKGGK